MDAEYSRRGLKYVSKADSVFNFPIMCLIDSFEKFQGVIALIVSWLKCLVHDKSSELLNPRYLTFFADWRVRPCSL